MRVWVRRGTACERERVVRVFTFSYFYITYDGCCCCKPGYIGILRVYKYITFCIGRWYRAPRPSVTYNISFSLYICLSHTTHTLFSSPISTRLPLARAPPSTVHHSAVLVRCRRADRTTTKKKRTPIRD